MSISFRDVYLGRPDASDEVAEDGYEKFVESFIMPPSFDIDTFLSNGLCYITGYKGTGKSALLWYLKGIVQDRHSALTEFISFKKDYSEAQRHRMSAQAQRISTILPSPTYRTDANDYEYIWKWELFKKINDINGKNHSAIFKNDENWKAFKKTLHEIQKDAQITKFVLNPSVMYGYDGRENLFSAQAQGFFPQMEENTNAYTHFVSLVSEAEDHFKKCKRTATPFYLFIDELEAYHGDNQIFIRDLSMIRDIILVIKQINQIMRKENQKNALIVLAVRTEIRHAINREIVSKEINKVFDGFEYRLNWNFNDTDSIEHPLFAILLKRIQMSEKALGSILTYEEIFEKWFPIKQSETYGSKTVVSYLLDNTWNKPRDIVNMLKQINNLCPTDNHFSPALFTRIKKNYSTACRDEIREEMTSCYSSHEIEEIFSILLNFKSVFTEEEFKTRIKNRYPVSKWSQDSRQCIRNLYRFGIIGNFSLISQTHRWHYRDDESPILEDDWQFVIHGALRSVFSISYRHENARAEKQIKADQYVGSWVKITVKRIDESAAFVDAYIGEKKEPGVIFKGEISNQYVNNIADYIWEGQETEAMVLGFDKGHNKWRLSLI